MLGRPMKGFVILNDPLKRKRAELSKWMTRAFEYSLTLPLKEKKVKSGAKKPTVKKKSAAAGEGKNE